MFQLIKQDNMFERKEQRDLKDEVTYYIGLSGQFEEGAINEEDILSELEEQGND